MKATHEPPNVFLLHVRPAPGAAAPDVARRMTARARDFALASRPSLPPSLLSHRILWREGGALWWEVAFDGIDVPAADSSESLAEAILEEARESLAGLAEVEAAGAFVDLLLPAPDRGFSRDDGEVAAFGDDLPGWESYAEGSGEAEAGTPLPGDLLEVIGQNRANVPGEPGLKPHGKGHMYAGNTDKAHLAYLKAYFEARAAKASPADRRKILAFLAFQSREGSTAAINTYDNQIVTWGTGWGGLGWLGAVMGRTVAHEAARDRLGRAGVRYRGKGTYDVVDLDARAVITGKQPALQLIQRSLDLLHLLIDVARNPATRDGATEAQLVTFMEGSAGIAGADAIFTQALFNYVAHLKHWAPGFITGGLEWAVPRVQGPPSAERDRALAVLLTRYFYGKARAARGNKWIPDWKQLLLYVGHMKHDGLDCTGEPFFKATAPPDDDPFAAAPPPAEAPAAAPQPAPAKAAPPPAEAPAAAPQPAPAKAAPSPAPAGPLTPGGPALTRPVLAGQPELAAVASGKAALRKGSRGAAVKAVQQALLSLGIAVPGGADGAFGDGLEGAVKAFQAAQGLGADGVIGQATLRTLDARLANRTGRPA